MFDVYKVRQDFPILNQKVNGQKLIYLDNAATSQKPLLVLEAMDNYYRNYNANVHRSIHTLGEKATEAVEDSRNEISKFLNCNSEEIIFTQGTSMAVNILSYGLGQNLKKGDEIIVSILEHHSNFVPWQLLAKEKSLNLKIWDCDDNGNLNINGLKNLITPRTKILSITHASNVLGTIIPITEISKIAKTNGITLIVDGAQSTPHLSIDVKKLGCDYFFFSGHKILGPTGVSILYGKKENLDKLTPKITGSAMISNVSADNTTFLDTPLKFEPGTPNISGIIGLGAAIKYLNNIGLENVRNHEISLLKHCLSKLMEISDITIYGPIKADDRTGLFSFNIKSIHPHDIAQILDQDGIAIRSGHHCAIPIHRRLGLESTSRVSFYFYNTKEEIDKFIESLKKVKLILK